MTRPTALLYLGLCIVLLAAGGWGWAQALEIDDDGLMLLSACVWGLGLAFSALTYPLRWMP